MVVQEDKANERASFPHKYPETTYKSRNNFRRERIKSEITHFLAKKRDAHFKMAAHEDKANEQALYSHKNPELKF